MSFFICKNPTHIHSTIIPPSESCTSNFYNFIAYSPRPITINFEKFKFKKNQVTKINEEINEENNEEINEENNEQINEKNDNVCN